MSLVEVTDVTTRVLERFISVMPYAKVAHGISVSLGPGAVFDTGFSSFVGGRYVSIFVVACLKLKLIKV